MKRASRTSVAIATQTCLAMSALALVACGDDMHTADRFPVADSAPGDGGSEASSFDGSVSPWDAASWPEGGQDALGDDSSPVDAGSVDAAGDSSDPVEPATGLRVGLWISPWDLHRHTPAEWVRGIKGLSYASPRPNQAVVVFGLCGAADSTTFCQFPKPDGMPDYPNIEYGGDVVTPILDAIEADGSIDVILDVEPMNAHVSDLMHVVMTRYGSYHSVVGFSPDWEWVTGDGDKQGMLPVWKDELDVYRPRAWSYTSSVG